MAFKEIADLSTETAIALGGINKKTNKPNPTTVTGYYVGSREVDSPKSKTGKANLYVFQTAKGNVGVWGKTDLDIKMKAATLGALTRVTFTGMQPTKNNPMYKFKVEIDETDAVEVSAPEASAPAEEDAQDDGAYEADLDEAPTYEAEEEPVLPPARRPAAPAQAPAADRIAAMKAKLKRA